jgi:hypothetical protein
VNVEDFGPCKLFVDQFYGMIAGLPYLDLFALDVAFSGFCEYGAHPFLSAFRVIGNPFKKFSRGMALKVPNGVFEQEWFIAVYNEVDVIRHNAKGINV